MPGGKRAACGVGLRLWQQKTARIDNAPSLGIFTHQPE